MKATALLVLLIALPAHAAIELCEVLPESRIQLCGFEDVEYHAYEHRIDDILHTPGPARVEALRALACARPERSKDLREAIDLLLFSAAITVVREGSDDTLVALVESGRDALIRGATPGITERRPPSPQAWTRIERVLTDHSLDPEARCAVVGLLYPPHDEDVRRIANDLDDPIQHCAAQFVAGYLTSEERRALVADPSAPMHAEAAMLGGLEGEPVSKALCRVASDPRRPKDVRLAALFALPRNGTPENVACLESLLDPATWVGDDRSSTLDAVISRYLSIDPGRALAIAHSPLVSLLTIEQQDAIAERLENSW